MSEWFGWLRGDNAGGQFSYARLSLLLLPLLLILAGLIVLVRRIRRLGFWQSFKRRQVEDKTGSVVEFYERMTKALSARGLSRDAGETPLEFASATGIPEAVNITRAYNRVRFGEQNLSMAESSQIEDWLRRMEGKQP
jgi:hypothetical protein